MSPITPRPVFCFDKEGLSDEDVLDLRRRSKYQIYFLARRNIESYFLLPSVIASLFRRDYAEITLAGDPVSVESALRSLASAKPYGAKGLWSDDLRDPRWLGVVDGASLLRDTFAEISGKTVSYVKTRDTLALLALALEEHPPWVDELINLVAELDEKVTKLAS
jgi:hypothetical protein